MDISVRRETFAQPSHLWLGSSHGTDAARTVTIDVSELTANTHYPNGYLPDGTPLGLLDGSDLYGVYDGTDPDTLAGFLLEPVKVTGDADVAGALLDHGRVIEEHLPFPIDSDGIADVKGQIVIIEAGGGS